MRRWAVRVLAAALPAAAMAEDAVIRIEAKRTAEAAGAAAAQWAQRLEGAPIVTFPLASGWTGIAIGPLPQADAEARLTQLQAGGLIPADSFVSQPADGTVLTPLGQEGAAAPAPVPPATFIQLAAHQDEGAARDALTKTREAFPGAGLWKLPNGWFAVALGPVDPAAAQALARRFSRAALASASTPGSRCQCCAQ